MSFQIPLTSTCSTISNFALCGMPFLAGFYSKDLILEIVSLDYVNLLGYFLFYFLNIYFNTVLSTTRS